MNHKVGIWNAISLQILNMVIFVVTYCWQRNIFSRKKIFPNISAFHLEAQFFSHSNLIVHPQYHKADRLNNISYK